MHIGGSADNGKIEAGRYFLSNDGVYTEVSRAVFNYSKYHTDSLFITHPFLILAAFCRDYLKRNRGQKQNETN